jgi:aconitate hydratase
LLLGVKAVIAESFERIHRSNLVNMGVLPLEFLPGETAALLGLTGRETFDLLGTGESLIPRSMIVIRATGDSGRNQDFKVRVRIDTPEELTAFKHGGILPYVLRRLASS